MKQLVFLLAFAFINIIAGAQVSPASSSLKSIDQLQVSLNGDNLQVLWKSTIRENANYWEVQASEDGKNFVVIGLVLGSDPKGLPGEYVFKQSSKKIRKNLKFYRVVHIEDSNTAVASNTIRL